MLPSVLFCQREICCAKKPKLKNPLTKKKHNRNPEIQNLKWKFKSNFRKATKTATRENLHKSLTKPESLFGAERVHQYSWRTALSPAVHLVIQKQYVPALQ